MPQYGFSAGALWGVASGSNQTPVRFGALQSAAVDFSSTIKPLFGSNQLPLTQARGTMNVTGKANLAQMKGRLLSDLFFSSSLTTGQIIAADNESGIIPATPYAITVTNSATWTVDLGVIFSATGIPLVRVASGPATGQYSVASGVYTFAAADTTLGVKISYEYTTTGGDKFTMANLPTGQAPTFKTVLSVPYNSQYFNITLNACTANKTSFNTSLEDFTKQDFEFAAFVDSSDNLGTMSFAELS